MFLLGTLTCLGLMGLEIFRPVQTHKKNEATKEQPLKRPPEVPIQRLDDFPQIASPLPPDVVPLPGLQISLPTLAPLQQHAFGGMLVRPLQTLANPSPAAPPITQSIRTQESPVPSGPLR